MNQQDRKRVVDLREQLQKLAAASEDIGSQLDTIADAQQEKLDNMSETAQESERGQELETIIEMLGNAVECAGNGDLEGAIDALEEIEE